MILALLLSLNGQWQVIKLNTKHFKMIRQHLLIALFLLTLGIFDGSFSYVFQKYFYTNTMSLICRIMLMGLVLTIFFIPNERYIVLIAAIVGLIYDSFFTGILGIHAFLLGLLAYVLRYFADDIPHTPLFIGLVYVLSLAFVETGVYYINAFIGMTRVDFTDFVATTLGPTIALNVVLFIILYFPLSRLLLKLKTE